jgi:hypothetical protein
MIPVWAPHHLILMPIANGFSFFYDILIHIQLYTILSCFYIIHLIYTASAIVSDESPNSSENPNFLLLLLVILINSMFPAILVIFPFSPPSLSLFEARLYKQWERGKGVRQWRHCGFMAVGQIVRRRGFIRTDTLQIPPVRASERSRGRWRGGKGEEEEQSKAEKI